MRWLYISLTDEFTLAGLGVLLAGIGAVLSGWAAVRANRKRKEKLK